MVTAATTADLGSADPYGLIQGARGWVWRRDGWFACLGGEIRPHQKNRDEHGVLALGGHHLTATHNNQPIVGGSGGGELGDEMCGG